MQAQLRDAHSKVRVVKEYLEGVEAKRSSRKRQPSVATMLGLSKEVVEELSLAMILFDGHPLQMFSTPAAKLWLAQVAGTDLIPDRRHLDGPVLDRLQRKVMAASYRKLASCDAITVSLDGCKRGDAMLYCVVYSTPDPVLVAIRSAPYSKSSDNLLALIRDVVDSKELAPFKSKIVSLPTDGGAGLAKARRLWAEEEGKLSSHCAAHVLNLAVSTLIDRGPVKRLLRTLARALRSGDGKKALVREGVAAPPLDCDNQTRWSASADMVASLFVKKGTIRRILRERSGGPVPTIHEGDVRAIAESSDFWDDLEGLCGVLQMLADYQDALQADSCSLADLYAYYHGNDREVGSFPTATAS